MALKNGSFEVTVRIPEGPPVPVSEPSREYFPRSFEDHLDVIGQCETGLWVVWVSSGSGRGTVPWTPFFPCLSLFRCLFKALDVFLGGLLMISCCLRLFNLLCVVIHFN